MDDYRVDYDGHAMLVRQRAPGRLIVWPPVGMARAAPFAPAVWPVEVRAAPQDESSICERIALHIQNAEAVEEDLLSLELTPEELDALADQITE